MFRIRCFFSHLESGGDIRQIVAPFHATLQYDFVSALVDRIKSASPGTPGTDDIAPQHRLSEDG